jgi:hypothetical protein
LPAISSRQAATTEAVEAVAVAADVATKAVKNEGLASKAPPLSQLLQVPLQLHRRIHNLQSEQLASLYLTVHTAIKSTLAAQPCARRPIPT